MRIDKIYETNQYNLHKEGKGQFENRKEKQSDDLKYISFEEILKSKIQNYKFQ